MRDFDMDAFLEWRLSHPPMIGGAEGEEEGEPDELVEAAQGAEETDGAADEWANFDANRAKSTILAQREAEKELKERLRLLEEDDDAFAELARKRGYEIDSAQEDDSEEEEEFEDDDPDPVAEKLTKLEQWQQAQDQKAEQSAIKADIEAINDGSDWDLDDHDRAVIEAWARSATKGKQFTRDHLETAHKAYIDRLEALASKAVERAKKPKPKPQHVTQAGKANTGVKDVSDMTRRELDAWMLEQAQANS